MSHNFLKKFTWKYIKNKNFKLFIFIVNGILILVDKGVKKNKNYWIFPVYFIGSAHFSDNMLAVFEIIKDDENIKKIILTKGVDVNVQGKNVEVIQMNSFKAISYLLKAKIIFVQHSLWLDLSQAIFQIKTPLNRHIINLWHGIPIKDISHVNTGIINARALKEMPIYNVIASSAQDLINMQKAFFKVPQENFWITGLPRNDFLLMDETKLPNIYKDELIFLNTVLKNNSFILYAPTYREVKSGGEQYKFSEDELDTLESFLLENNVILGLRYHSYLEPQDYSNILKRANIIDVSSNIISDVRMLIRKADLIVTDYSSLFIDALYIDKKCLSFAYDFEHYQNTQRGFFYDFEDIFPGEICYSFDELLLELQNYDKAKSESIKEKSLKAKKIFYKYSDTKNSQRVVDKVKDLQ